MRSGLFVGVTQTTRVQVGVSGVNDWGCAKGIESVSAPTVASEFRDSVADERAFPQGRRLALDRLRALRLGRTFVAHLKDAQEVRAAGAGDRNVGRRRSVASNDCSLI